MKALYLLFITFSLSAFAGGSLSLEPAYDPERDRTHITFGLGIGEELGSGLAYSSWTGIGDSFDLGTGYHSWGVSKHQIDIKTNEGLTFSPGFRVNYVDDRELSDKKRLYGEIYAKASYKLW